MNIRRLVNGIGVLLCLVSTAFDFLYAVKAPFASKLLYYMTIITVVSRMIFNFGICQYLYVHYVWNYRAPLSSIGEAKYREEE